MEAHKQEWMQEITEDDLDEEALEIADMIGLDNYIRLADVYGGTRIYIKKLDTPIERIRNRHIIEEYDRKNLKRLAFKYGLSENQIRKIAGDDSLDGQITLFET